MEQKIHSVLVPGEAKYSTRNEGSYGCSLLLFMAMIVVIDDCVRINENVELHMTMK